MNAEKRGMKMLIAGGGTGGHVFPAIAVAEELIRRGDDNEVLFVGTGRGLEARVIPKAGYRLQTIDVAGLMGKGFMGVLTGLKKIPGSIIRSRAVIREFKPDVVMGVGGYVSGPVVITAHFMGIRTAVAEQNAVPGMTNNILGRFADRIFVSFEETSEWFPVRRVLYTGNPVRSGFARPAGKKKPDDGVFTLLIFGGSQGASSINRSVIAALPYLEDLKESLVIIHQAGMNDRDEVEEAYLRRGLNAKVVDFIDDMPAVYEEADLLICRAGATSIAEITAMGKASLLIPYPYATGNHQVLNARALVKKGAAEMLEEKDCTGESLAMHIRDMYRDPTRRQSMEVASKDMGNPDAAGVIVDHCFDLLQ
mgnify:CR=1 FL=1